MSPDGVAERSIDHAGDGDLTPRGDEQPVVKVCPSCRELGDKTERVGTRKCETRKCRVHFYQEARPQDVIE